MQSNESFDKTKVEALFGSADDLDGTTDDSQQQQSGNSKRSSNNNPLDSPLQSQMKPAWVKHTEEHRKEQQEARERSGSNSPAAANAATAGDNRDGAASETRATTGGHTSNLHQDPNDESTASSPMVAQSSTAPVSSSPTTTTAAATVEILTRLRSETLKSDDGEEYVNVSEGPLSLNAFDTKIKRTPSMFEEEQMSAPAALKFKIKSDEEFDDCSGLERMTAENWSRAPRFGFPAPIQGTLAEAEREARDTLLKATRQSEEHWDQALKSGANLLAAANEQVVEQLQRLSRKYGIPAHLRGIIWLTLSGVAVKMEENPGFCGTVMRKWGETTGDAAHCIEKDLERTFPEHPYFAKGEPGIKRLKNVLHALCWRNPLLTYCQSFNFLAGTLLLFLDDEEAVFWMMLHILENLLPNDYYGEGLIGLKIDQEVVMYLLNTHCPKLSDHCQDIKFDVRALVPAWLMSLFIGTFPIETTIRVWDYMLTNNPKQFTTVPIAVLVAFLKMNQEEFLKVEDAGELHMCMGNRAQKMYDGNKLVKAAHDLKLQGKEIAHLRRVARQNILVDLQNQKRRREQYHKQQAKRMAELADRAARGEVGMSDSGMGSPMSPLSAANKTPTSVPGIGHSIQQRYWEEDDIRETIEMSDVATPATADLPPISSVSTSTTSGAAGNGAAPTSYSMNSF